MTELQQKLMQTYAPTHVGIVHKRIPQDREIKYATRPATERLQLFASVPGKSDLRIKQEADLYEDIRKALFSGNST